MHLSIKNLLIYLIMPVITMSCIANERDYKNYNKSLSEIISVNNIDVNNISILIDKSDYKLTILADSIIIKEYPVVFGGNSEDDKLMQGDQCTPEGSFKIISKYPHKNWTKFIWINYPNDDSRKKHQQAKDDGKIPKDANIGGEIGIHGVPDDMDMLIDLKQNWTLGCISLKNKDVDEIYPYINNNTIIFIQK